jgi:hypothetical protein
MGKAAVTAITVFIVISAIARTYSKYMDDKIQCQMAEQIVKRIDKVHDNLGEVAIRFQKYLDKSKKGDFK